jgi:hypothetical protein
MQRGLPVFVLTAVAFSAGVSLGCQDSYSSNSERDTYMGDLHAAETPTAPRVAAPPASATTPPSATAVAPIPPAATGPADQPLRPASPGVAR